MRRPANIARRVDVGDHAGHTRIRANTGFDAVFRCADSILADNAAALNLKNALHEGDVTEHNVAAEWDNSLEAMNRLNGVVPYTITTGNHDVGPDGSALNCRNSGFTDPQYFGPGSNYASQPSIGGFSPDGNTANSWHTFSVGNQNWLILNLEWEPPDRMSLGQPGFGCPS